jgi:AraC-type DNA-binding domain-containing proteins
MMLFILAFYIINQPELGKESLEMYSILNNLNIKHNNTPVKRYEKVNLDIHTQETYLKLLDEYMKKNKPYLNERITIKDLSEGLNVPYYHLSIVINNLLNKNFYDFINEYRIREVLSILNESKNEAVNILTIAFKCGFNSKSTFNRVFKNKMGTTPSLYKNGYK